MFESGRFVAEHVEPVSPEQVQPNGVDLTLDRVFEQRTPGRLGRDGKRIGDRAAAPVAIEGGPAPGDDGSGDDGVPVYTLGPGGYVVRYAERVRIPERHVGFLYPRSSLLRNSCMLNTAVWDAGYEGKGEGLLQVHHTVELERGARVAQLVLAEAEHTGEYDGSFQGENL